MKNQVTWLATAGLLAVAVLAYFGNQWLAQGPSAAGAAKADGAPPAKVAAGAGKDAAKEPPKDGKAAAKGAGAVPVEVVVLKRSQVQEDVQAVGSLRSNESVVLRPEVAGRIAQFGFRDGQPVKKGQLLVALDATLNEAEVAKARAELALATSNQKRTDDLASKAFVSGAAQEQANSNVQVLEANLKLAEARLAKMRIVAPFDGVVGIRNISVGDYVKDGADLVNVEDVQTLKADFRLPERMLTQVKVGQAVEIVADARPGERFAGTVDAINPRIDASGRSLEVRARLANRGGLLRPGMFARVRVIVGSRDNALLVPEEAIVPSGEDFYVFKVIGKEDAGQVAQRVRVRIGVRRDAKVEIVDGLAEGDRVVVAGMRLARDGQPVRVVSRPGADAGRKS
jgi:membrane fusion protein (multidrug efflux system)